MLAALNGRSDIVGLLLAAGAAVNQSGWTPLMYAAVNNHSDVARQLLGRGALVNATAQNGTSALMMAAREGHLQMVLLLLEQGRGELHECFRVKRPARREGARAKRSRGRSDPRRCDSLVATRKCGSHCKWWAASLITGYVMVA